MKILKQAEQYPERCAVLHTAIPEYPSRRWKEKLMDRLVQQYEGGEPMGFTLRDELGDGPSSGTMVSYPPGDNEHNRGVPLSDVTAKNLAAAALTRRERVHSDPDNFFGTWVEDDSVDPYGRLFADVSESIDEPNDALEQALVRDQIAGMDNDKVDSKGKPLDSAFVYTAPWASSGPASATGFIHSRRRR